MEPFFKYYTAYWSAACTVAAVMLFMFRGRYSLLSREYIRHLFVPWKLVTFIIAGSVVTFVAPYSGDPTWDYVDGSLMSILTFTTAPWVVGTLYRAYRGREEFVQVYVALVVMMFSASWSYDLWILLRDGIYTPSWLSNIPLSATIYIVAGLLWSLEHGPRGGAFSFTAENWPYAVNPAKGWMPPPLAALFLLFGMAWVLPFLWVEYYGG